MHNEETVVPCVLASYSLCYCRPALYLWDAIEAFCVIQWIGDVVVEERRGRKKGATAHDEWQTSEAELTYNFDVQSRASVGLSRYIQRYFFDEVATTNLRLISWIEHLFLW